MSMRTEFEIRNRINKIDADERYHYPSARVDVNAPLALIQVALGTEAIALAWVLGEIPPRSGPKKNKLEAKKGKRK
mgnify:CR=1 FL=1